MAAAASPKMLAIRAGYLGGSGLALRRLVWQIAVELPTREAAASLALQAARALPAVALALPLYGCARAGVAPARGALQLLFAAAGAFHAGRAWVGRGPVGAAASAGWMLPADALAEVGRSPWTDVYAAIEMRTALRTTGKL